MNGRCACATDCCDVSTGLFSEVVDEDGELDPEPEADNCKDAESSSSFLFQVHFHFKE